MAAYQDASILVQLTHDAFNKIYTPGTKAPDAGIYRCTGCGYEIGTAEEHDLPPQIHNTHPPGTPIRWELVVFAQHKGVTPP